NATSVCEDSDDESDEELTPGCAKSLSAGPKIPTIDIQRIPSTVRDYDHAIIHACNGAEWTQQEQQRTINIMDAYKLRPIKIINENKVEANALTHERNLWSCSHGNMQVSPVVPGKKRKLDTTSACDVRLKSGHDTAAMSLNASLFGALSSGPYAKHFLDEAYIEISEDLANFLNQDWSICPNLRFACSRLLAGMLFLNMDSGKALVANSVEVYCRDRNIDSHHEHFKASKNTTPANSLPPKICRYPGIWPTTLDDADGKKLVVGTKTFNALITSSLRLDIHSTPEIGPATCQFLLENERQSVNTQLFVKESAWKAAKALAEDKSASFILPYDILHQMRQLRTRFHHRSTYSCCRSFNEMTDDLTARPYTIFTITGYDNAREDSNYRSASKLFRQIALAIIRGDNVLTREDVDANARKVKAGAIEDIFTSILDLFDKDTTTISIIGNSRLNKHFGALAKLLSSPISTANESISKAVAHVYR
ncbi:hypothetical protein DFQ30_002570, partial [Apophysomyces sp. BC1015]